VQFIRFGLVESRWRAMMQAVVTARFFVIADCARLETKYDDPIPFSRCPVLTRKEIHVIIACSYLYV
jgi:hypothetical protein